MTNLTISPAQRAIEVDARIREIGQFVKTSFIEIGVLCCEVEDKELHKYLCDEAGVQYRTFDDWLSRALPFCRSSAYQAKRLVRTLHDVPVAQLAEIPRSNLEVLKFIPESERRDEIWLRKARECNHDTFFDLVRRELPDLLLEHKRKMILSFCNGQYEFVDGVCKKIQERHQCSREEAIEALAASYREDGE